MEISNAFELFVHRRNLAQSKFLQKNLLYTISYGLLGLCVLVCFVARQAQCLSGGAVDAGYLT